MPALFTEQHPLQALHSFSFVQHAAYFADVRTEQQLCTLLQAAKQQQLRVLPLGEGSNLLFTKRFDGVVLRISLRGIRYLQADPTYHYLQVAAGENWHAFVQYCLAQGYHGLENLSLIPGTVGAAPVQNIGAYGVSLSDFVVSLETYNVHTHVKQVMEATACAFRYRDSLFKSQAPDTYVITSVTLRLPKKWQPTLHYQGLQEHIQRTQANNASPTPKDVAAAVIALRQEKLPDPAVLPNAGSFFQNPTLSADAFAYLRRQHPTIRGHVTGTVVKLSAAQLIEACGWKGYRQGGVGVYPKHALVLVHYGGATAHELQTLITAIQTAVQQRFGVELLPEVRMV